MSGLSAAPLTRRLISWVATTGDDAPLVAAGFDVPVGLVELLLRRPEAHIGLEDAELLCRRMRLDPNVLWPEHTAVVTEAMASWAPDRFLGEVVGWETWPLLDFPDVTAS